MEMGFIVPAAINIITERAGFVILCFDAAHTVYVT